MPGDTDVTIWSIVHAIISVFQYRQQIHLCDLKSSFLRFTSSKKVSKTYKRSKIEEGWVISKHVFKRAFHFFVEDDYEWKLHYWQNLQAACTRTVRERHPRWQRQSMQHSFLAFYILHASRQICFPFSYAPSPAPALVVFIWTNRRGPNIRKARMFAIFVKHSKHGPLTGKPMPHKRYNPAHQCFIGVRQKQRRADPLPPIKTPLMNIKKYAFQWL